MSENGVYSIVKYNQDHNTNYNGFDRVFVSINGETLSGYPIRENGIVRVSDMIDDGVMGISRESYFDVEVVPTSGINISQQSNKDVFISYRQNQLESSIEITPDQGYDTLDKVTVNWKYGCLGNNGDNVLINTTKGAQQIYGNNGNNVVFGTNWFNDPENDNSVTNTQELFYGFPSDNSDIIGISEFTLKGKIENKTITQNGTYYPYDNSTIIKKIVVDISQQDSSIIVDYIQSGSISPSTLNNYLTKIEKDTDIQSKRSKFYVIWKMNNRDEIKIRLAMIRNISNSNILINNFVFKDHLPGWNIIPSRFVFDQTILKLGPWGKLNLIQLSSTGEVLNLDDDEESWKMMKTIGFT